MASDTGDNGYSSQNDTDFSDREVELFQRIRSLVIDEVGYLIEEQQHRSFLGGAAVLVDEAAKLASQTNPGLKVVQLSMLAQRLSELALRYPEPDND